MAPQKKKKPTPKKRNPTAQTVGVSRKRQHDLLKAFKTAGSKGLTWEQMTAVMNGQRRAAERAFAALRAEGAVINKLGPDEEKDDEKITKKPRKTTFGKTVVYVLEVAPKWEVALTREARLALGVAEIALDQMGSELWAEHLRSLEKVIEEALGADETASLLEQMKSLTLPKNKRKSVSIKQRDFLLAIMDAVMGKSCRIRLQLKYRHTGRPEAELLEVVPHSIIQDPFAGATYLLAWDCKQQKPWNFRLNRIEGVKALGPGTLSDERRTLLERAAEYQIGAWPHIEEPDTVRVRIKGKTWIRHFMDTPPALPGVNLVPLPSWENPKDLIIEFQANGIQGPDRWVLQLGGAAEVLEPEWLRNAIIQQLDIMKANYTAPPSPKKRVRPAPVARVRMEPEPEPASTPGARFKR